MTKITENSDSTQNLKLDVTKLQSEDTLIKNEILDIEQNQRNASQIFQNYNTELKNFKADQERSMESYKAYNNQTLVSERHEMSRLLDRVYANVSEFELLFKKQDDYLVD
jgi:F0F1-type ATP synthase membrane subunit b/b'